MIGVALMLACGCLGVVVAACVVRQVRRSRRRWSSIRSRVEEVRRRNYARYGL